MNDTYFDGKPTGYEFTMPGIALSGLVREAYSTELGMWRVTHTDPHGHDYIGVSITRPRAYLNMIAARLGEASNL
jgi:hypothetical protein